jgi:hypothetical protein
MTSLQLQPSGELDFERARRSVLRFQPASNWVGRSRDPTPRMTIGFGFDLGRADAPEFLRRAGVDPATVRIGRAPVSDAQMNELFDLTLEAAIAWAEERIPGFAEISSERQSALLELIVWLGSFGVESVFAELEQLGLPLTGGPLEASPWFDAPRQRADPLPQGAPARQALPLYETVFESFGVVAQLVCDDPGLLADAHAMLPPGWRAVDGQPSIQFAISNDGLITVDGARADRAADRESLLLKLASVIRHQIAIEAPGLTFVHAGVVDVGGCGIVIPGRSYSGKSVLVAELVRLGATYVSDEYAVIDRNGRLLPFAKPLSIRAGGDDPWGRLVDVPDDRVAHDPVRPGLIVVTGYCHGARWHPSVRSPGEGALALLQNTVSARRTPGPALRATGLVARTAVTLAGRRGEAWETARALLETALLRGGEWHMVCR